MARCTSSRACAAVDSASASSASASLVRGQHVLGHRERRVGRRPVLERVGAQPRMERRSELLAEAALVEGGDLVVAFEVGVDPLRERRHVDLRLRVREIGRPRGLHPRRVRGREGLGLLTRPPARLVAAPRRGDGRRCEQHRGHDLHPRRLGGLTSLGDGHTGGRPRRRGGHRRGAAPGAPRRAPRAIAASPRVRGDRPAPRRGCRGPRARAGSPRCPAVTVPAIRAWATAGSPLSAKNST